MGLYSWNEMAGSKGGIGYNIDKYLLYINYIEQYLPDEQINTTGKNIVFKSKIY